MCREMMKLLSLLMKLFRCIVPGSETFSGAAGNGKVRTVGQIDADPILRHLMGFLWKDTQGTVSIVRQVSHACLDSEFYGIRVSAAISAPIRCRRYAFSARFFSSLHGACFSNGDLLIDYIWHSLS